MNKDGENRFEKADKMVKMYDNEQLSYLDDYVLGKNEGCYRSRFFDGRIIREIRARS